MGKLTKQYVLHVITVYKLAVVTLCSNMYVVQFGRPCDQFKSVISIFSMLDLTYKHVVIVMLI